MTDVRIARRRRWAVGLAMAAVLGTGACGDDDEAAPATTERSTTTSEATTTSTAPPRPTSTTTTMFDPASVEGEVEAAYLRSWEVYADAVYNLELDEAALREVYADPLLSVRLTEIRDRVEEGRAALVEVDHDYQITLIDSVTASLVDVYVNHQVLIDPDSKQPIEDDPNATLTDVATLSFSDGRWRVTDLRRVR